MRLSYQARENLGLGFGITLILGLTFGLIYLVLRLSDVDERKLCAELKAKGVTGVYLVEGVLHANCVVLERKVVEE